MNEVDSLEQYLQGFFDNVALRRRLARALEKQLELQKTLRRSAGGDGLRKLAILLLFYGTDLLARELGSLRVESLSFGEGSSARLDVPGDSGTVRRIVLSEEITNVLKRYLSAQGGRSSGPLFLDARGRRLHENDVFRLVRAFPNESMMEELGQHCPITSRSECAVLPVPLRLNSDPRYTGRGVTMAFIDSGFYPHPDIMQPKRRLLAYKNVAGGTKNDFEKPDVSSWHGMQTSVSAAGNGYLSGGLYRGIASDANLVLVQVTGPKGISYKTILNGFEWVIKKKDRYNIRILNVSLGSGTEQSYHLSPLDGAAEDAVQAGIVVLVAVGNEGYDPELNIITPPASAPSVITVGGLNDRNSLNLDNIVPYHSNFGETVDGVVKPEIVAPGIWVAAPILPGSPLFQKAQLLWELKDVEGRELRLAVEGNLDRLGMSPEVLDLSDSSLAREINREISREKIIAPHYQHVDGTSFSSPIVGSVIAQMLEANPSLTPELVKEILIRTAISLPGISREQQGYGMVHPGAAVEEALRHVGPRGRKRISAPLIEGNDVTFVLHNDTAAMVTVAGSFNGWDPEEYYLERKGREKWEITLTVPEPGRYYYKFIVNGERWIPDPQCLRNETDGFGGKNSVFKIHTYVDTDKKLTEIDRDLRHNLPGIGDSNLRKRALTRLDEIFRLETIAQSADVRFFFTRQWERLLKALSGPRPRKFPSVHLLYNMGVIYRTPRLSVAFDLVSTRHVLGVYWEIEDELLERTVDACDVLFITHRHADHLDFEMAGRMLAAGKTVIGPSEAVDVLPRGVLAFEPGEKREIFGVGPRNAGLSITAHDGVHVLGRTTPIRVYEVVVDGKSSIVHAGDHDFAGDASFKLAGRPDILVAGLVGVRDGGLEKIEKKLKPSCVLLAHLAELGHTLDLGRPGYGDAYEQGEQHDIACAVLSWGEGYVLKS